MARYRSTASRPPEQITVAERLARYWSPAQTHYTPTLDGPNPALGHIAAIIRLMREPYGATPACEFARLAPKAVRSKMVFAEWSRTDVNEQVRRVVRVWRYGVENERVGPKTVAALLAVPGLRVGKTDARETEPIKPVKTLA